MSLAVLALEPDDDATRRLIAERMRATLVEVLGEERGEAMCTLEWLEDRVRFHLAPERAVFVAELEGEVVGHTILREETDDEGRFGLFSTTYVDPAHRRAAIATALVERGEAWIRERELPRAVTYTADDNGKLIHLFEKRGYVRARMNDEMVSLSRAL